jgi:hypothetical protein
MRKADVSDDAFQRFGKTPGRAATEVADDEGL